MQTFELDPIISKPAPAIDFSAALNEEQLRVVQEADGPALVLAGAGSGKTRTITYRVAWLVAHGVAPQEILLLTFTNKAAAEMQRRVSELLGADIAGMWAGTFHSIGHRLLRQYAELLGYTGSFTILDADDARSLLKMCVREQGVDAGEKRFPSTNVLMDAISFSRNAEASIEDALERRSAKFTMYATTIGDIAKRYEARKKMANAMDFDDLLANTLRLLNEFPSVKKTLATQFRHVLVDEYQDTNPIQAALVDALASVHRNVLVVGDDAQSIYSFRAATIENILSFPERYPEAKTFRLEVNYRSGPEILALANDVISHNEKQFPKTLRPQRNAIAKPMLVPCKSGDEEAEFVVQSLLRLQNNGVALSRCAILFRATHHSQQVEFALTRRNIPYEYRGGMKFFERSHIKDVISYLKLIANPKETVAWSRILRAQEGIGETGAGRIADILSCVDVITQLLAGPMPDGISPRAQRGVQDALGIFRAATSSQDPGNMVRAIAGSSYADYLTREYPNAEDRLQDLESFAIFAEGFVSLDALLGEVTLKEDYGAARGSEPQEERLVLSTIHQAKGLEWDTVFVIRLAQGSFPSMRALADEGNIEEERRLLYVAVTRAQRGLFLTYPATLGQDTLLFQQPSMFLDEMRQGLLEEVRVSNRAGVTTTQHLPHRPSFARLGRATEGKPSATRWQTPDEEDTIERDALGEPILRGRPRTGGLLRDVSDL